MIQTSCPLNCYFSQKSHGHFTIEHRRACPLYAGGFGAVGLFWLPGAARLFPSSLAASEVPASPREDGDAEGKGRPGWE